MNLADFRTLHQEFRSLDDDVVQTHLNMAADSIDAAVFGVKYDRAHALKTADMLARSPFGRSLRLTSDDGTTVFAKELEELKGEVAVRMIVV